MRGNRLLLTGLALLAVGLGGLAVLSFGVLNAATLSSAGQGTPEANGARIYWTGITLVGRPIPYRGGMMMRMSYG